MICRGFSCSLNLELLFGIDLVVVGGALWQRERSYVLRVSETKNTSSEVFFVFINRI